MLKDLLTGRLALVTGAGRGNGAAIARGLAEAGARVIVTDIDTDAAHAVAETIVKAGGDARGHALDVTDHDGCRKLAEDLALLVGPIRIIGSVDEWFDPSVFAAVNHFGNLGRNAVTGPGFQNTDLSIVKNTRVSAGVHAQFRVDAFDVFNHPNFGSPGNVVGTATFGKILSTRFPTGEAGSSRQIQLAVKLAF